MIAAALHSGRHGGIEPPWRTLLLTGLALALYLWAGAAPEAWVYDRLAIARGEWWRLFTGHWVHSDTEHALWDIGALLILGLLFEHRVRQVLIPVLVCGTLCIDLWLWYVEPSLLYYCGLSGILNALLAVGLVRWWREERHPLIWVTGVGALSKIVWETLVGSAMLTSTAWPSVPEVHGVGFVGGLLLAALLYGHKESIAMHCGPLSRFTINRSENPAK